jgi:hypothetical protein
MTTRRWSGESDGRWTQYFLLRFLRIAKNRDRIFFGGNSRRSEQVFDTEKKVADNMREVKINYGVFLGYCYFELHIILRMLNSKNS